MTILQNKTVATGPTGETAQFMLVTPPMAAEWLTKNVDHNRNLKRGRIEGYVRDIESDNWAITGEAIKFDSSGNLIDGQNRCHAVVSAGIGIWTLVVRGVNPMSMFALDSGAGRNSADMLIVSGLATRAEAKDVAAIARCHYAVEIGVVKHAMSNLGGSVSLTKSELAERVSNTPQIEFAARYAKSLYKSIRLPVGPMGVALLKFSSIDLDATEQFFGRIKDGVQLGIGDPFTSLSRRVAQDSMSANHRMFAGTALFYLYRTWNAFRTNESLTKFQVGSPANGWTPIPKPE